MNYIDTDLPLTEFGPPEIIEIEPIHNCNLRCIQCHVSYEKLTKAMIDPSFVKRLKGLEKKWVFMGSQFEPVMHPKFGDIIRALSDQGMKIELTTNGTLFTEKLSNRLADCNWINVIISFDGILKETFEAIRRNANYERTLENILIFKNALKNKETYFAINYTLLRRNVDEVPDSVKFWEQHGFDHVGFIVMVIRNLNEILKNASLEIIMDYVYKKLEEAARIVIEGNYKITLTSALFNSWMDLKDLYPVNFMDSCVMSNNPDSRLPFNPRTYFQNGEYPGMQVNCRSPFKFARIYFDGNVDLCYQFTVGNIYETDFLDIWYGEKARQVRELVLHNAEVCYSCEYYKFCIKAGEVNFENKDSFQSKMVVDKYHKPMLIEDFGIYNIVGYRKNYYGFPKGLVSSDARFIKNVDKLKGIFIAESIDKIKELITDCLKEADRSDLVPTIVGDIDEYNIVAWKKEYYGIPKALGTVDLVSQEKEAIAKLEGVFIDQSLDKLKDRIRRHCRFNQKGLTRLSIFFLNKKCLQYLSQVGRGLSGLISLLKLKRIRQTRE